MSDPFEPFKKWQQSHQVSKFSSPKKTKRKAKTSAKNKIIRRLKYRAEYLDEEEKYTKDLLQKSTAAFHKAIARYCSNHPKAENPLVPVKNMPKEKLPDYDSETLSEEIKSIYREIAMATHPDKQHDDPEEMLELFRNATEAKDEHKVEDLINISFELDIDISEISIELVEEIEKNLDKKEEEISCLRKNASIIWYKSNKQKRLKMIKAMCPDKNK